MSGHPQGGHYDDGYGHQGQAQAQPHGQDSYYHDDQQYGQYHDDARGQQGHYQQNGNDAYYDEQYVLPLLRPPLQQLLTRPAVPTMTASRVATTSRMVATTTITTASRATKTNTTTTSTTIRAVPRMVTATTHRVVSPDAANTTLRRTLRPSATSQ